MAKAKKRASTTSLKDQLREIIEKAGEKGVKVSAVIRRFGKRTPARIYDLRADGLDIVTEPSRGPDCVYKIAKTKRRKKRKKRK